MRIWYQANYSGKAPPARDLRNYIKHRMDGYDSKIDKLSFYKVKEIQDDAVAELKNL